MLKQLFATTKVLILAIVLSFGLSYALAWTSPTATPPGANVAAPLNASATDQVKTGGLTAGSLTTAGLTTTGTLRVTTGAGATKVLTSDASGNATWQAAASGSGDNLGNHTATQALNMAGNNITSAGAITATNNAIATFGPNSTWGAYLDVGGNGRTTANASVATTNGNLHLDAKTGAFGTYLNWYSATGGTHVGNGATGYGLLYASDVYAGGKWMSAIPVITKSTTLYQAQAKATLQCWQDGTKATCTNTCSGALTTAATCSAVTSCATYSCNPATVFANTNLGRLVQ